MGKMVRITHIHKSDAHYHSRYRIIGMEGAFDLSKHHCYPGYYAGTLHPGDSSEDLFFVAVRYKKI